MTCAEEFKNVLEDVYSCISEVSAIHTVLFNYQSDGKQIQILLFSSASFICICKVMAIPYSGHLFEASARLFRDLHLDVFPYRLLLQSLL